MPNYKDTLSKYKKALNSVENKEQFKKASMAFLKEINKSIKEADKTSNLHTNFVVKKALDPKNGMDYCNQRGLGLDSQLGATMELGRLAVLARNKWSKWSEKVIKSMKKLESMGKRLPKHLATGDWAKVYDILSWAPKWNPAVIRHCALGGGRAGDVLAVLSSRAGLGAEFKLTYEKVERLLFLSESQNPRGLVAGVSALKNNATKFLNMQIMPEIMKSFSGGISLDSENISNIVSLKDLSVFLTKHPPTNINRFILNSLHTAAARNTENLNADAAEFIKEYPRLSRLGSDILVSEVIKVRNDPNYDATTGVLQAAQTDLNNYYNEFMKKVRLARKNLENQGLSQDIIEKKTKNTIQKYNVHIEYWHYALDQFSFIRMNRDWVGEGNLLTQDQYMRAFADADRTKEALGIWIKQQSFGTTVAQAVAILPGLQSYLDSWMAAVKFCRSSNELFKNWALAAKEIEMIAVQYGPLLDSLISAAETRGKNWKPKENIDRLKELKSKSTIGWSEIKKAKNNLTPQNIEDAIKTVCSRKDCDVGEDIVKTLCEEVNSVAKKYL